MYKRNKEIFEMRQAGISLEDIGIDFGISRERVRQILTYFCQVNGEKLHISKHYHTKKLFENSDFISSTRDKTNSELANILGISEGFVSTHRAKYRHAVAGDTNLTRGILYEEWVSNKLNELGIDNKLMPFRSPFDILALDTIRIDVKAAYKQWKPPSQKWTSKVYRFSTNKREGIDFYIFVIVETEDSFVVPIDEFNNHKSAVVFSWPIVKPRKNNKWQKYHEAWHLLANI